jgi:DHA2 family metal-tetracycline-proton antiporter-like MFS transporter
VRIHSVKEPFVQPKTFHNKKYTFGLFIAFLINIASVSLPFLSPLLLTSVHHLSSTWTALAMVPAAICSALFGRHGGKLADKKGNMYVFVLASILLFVCFSLLSTFIGLSPIYLAVFLIFGNIGQSFIMIAMSNSISTTLSSDQAGVGMGILGMLNFITGGIASGIYGKLVDLHSTIAWNPANVFSNGSIFSNIFFILAILCIGIPIFYYFQFRTRLAENMGR